MDIGRLLGQNFLAYAREKFKDKFPFDAINTLTVPEAPKGCFSIDYFGKKEELCILGDFVSLSKYPVWIIFIIKLARMI